MPVSPRVLMPRFLFSASAHSLFLVPFLAVLSSVFAPSLGAGLCKVPSDSFAAAAAASTTFLASSSRRFCVSSCFLRKSSICIDIKVAWRFASLARCAICSAESKLGLTDLVG